MKIGVVTETFAPFYGGSARRYLEVFKRIVSRGHEVELHTVKLGAADSTSEEIAGIQVFRSPLLPGFITSGGFRDVRKVLRFTLWAIRNLLRIDGDIDLIEANHCPLFPPLGAKLVSILEGKPLSVTFHEAWHSDWRRYVPHGIYAPMGMLLEGMTVSVPDIAIAVSETTARRLVGGLGLDVGRMRLIPNGVDLEMISRVQAERDMHRIVYVGRLNPHKRVDWLIDAYVKVKRVLPDVSLEVVGDGPARKELERLAAGIPGVTFAGAVADYEVIRSLKSAAVCVLPSVREGQSITTLEAMGCGTPQVVVQASGNGASEVVSKAGSGLVQLPSSDSLAEGILRLLSSEDLWGRCHSRSLAFVSNYSWDRVAEEYLRAYESLL